MDVMNEALKRELLAVANDLADVARSATLSYFRTDELLAESKEQVRFDPVTAADRASEEAMRALLARLRPEDAILGEEFGRTEGSSGLTWVLDPIDGTRSYLSGTPTWGVLIGLRSAEGVLLGVIDQPYIGERFIGGFGTAEVVGPQGTRPLKARGARPLSDAILFSTFPEVGTEIEGRAFHQLSKRVKLTRYGLDCYAYALIAAGQIDLVVEAGLHAYDVVGPIGVIEAAGGIVTDWKGRPALEGGRILAAANTEIHAAALKILSEAPEG
jgi:histidinol phosphatase-like enzyme (inositol monophosphatase family)